MTRDLWSLFRCLLAVLISLAVGTANIQASDLKAVAGLVSDPSGAVIARASVTIQSADSPDVRSTETDGNGSFEFQLPPGTYRIEVKAAGFSSFRQDAVEISSTSSPRLDVVLKIEEHRESVEVTSEGNQMDLSSTEVGGGIRQEKLVAVPVNGRSFTDLLGLQAGVVPQSSKQSNAVVMSGCTTTPPSGDLNPGDVSVSGQRETANGFGVNGSSVEEDFNNIASIVPNLDSIAELAIRTLAEAPYIELLHPRPPRDEDGRRQNSHRAKIWDREARRSPDRRCSRRTPAIERRRSSAAEWPAGLCPAW